MKTIVVYTDQFEKDLQGHLTGHCEDWSNPEEDVFVIESPSQKLLDHIETTGAPFRLS